MFSHALHCYSFMYIFRTHHKYMFCSFVLWVEQQFYNTHAIKQTKNSIFVAQICVVPSRHSCGFEWLPWRRGFFLCYFSFNRCLRLLVIICLDGWRACLRLPLARCTRELRLLIGGSLLGTLLLPTTGKVQLRVNAARRAALCSTLNVHIFRAFIARCERVRSLLLFTYGRPRRINSVYNTLLCFCEGEKKKKNVARRMHSTTHWELFVRQTPCMAIMVGKKKLRG